MKMWWKYREISVTVIYQCSIRLLDYRELMGKRNEMMTLLYTKNVGHVLSISVAATSEVAANGVEALMYRKKASTTYGSYKIPRPA